MYPLKARPAARFSALLFGVSVAALGAGQALAQANYCAPDDALNCINGIPQAIAADDATAIPRSAPMPE